MENLAYFFMGQDISRKEVGKISWEKQVKNRSKKEKIGDKGK